MLLFSQSYNALWKQYDEAVSKDLPKTQISVLDKIINLSLKEKQYGQLLKAELRKVASVTSITPDSLQPAVRHLEQQAKDLGAKDPVLAAIYHSVLGTVYMENSSLQENSDSVSKEEFRKSLADPDLLAHQKAPDYEPLFDKGTDSKWFDHDLLHVLGFQAGDYTTLHDYYLSHGNRNAACLLACKMVEVNDFRYGAKASIQKLDSLIATYSDTEVTGELAVQRYSEMNNLRTYTVEDKVNYIDETLSKWGDWKRTNMLRNARNRMTEPSWKMDFGPKVILPHKAQTVKLEGVRNVERVTMTIHRVDIDARDEYNLSREKELKEVKKHIVSGTQMEFSREFPGKREFDISEDSLQIPPLEPGVYLAEVTSDHSAKMTEYFLFYVSDIYVFTQMLPGRKMRLAVVSATTGQPFPQAKVTVNFRDYYSSKKDMVENATCDHLGEVVFNLKENYSSSPEIYAYTSADKYCPDQRLWMDRYHVETGENSTKVDIYTDRSIYRPGQTVHVAILASSLAYSYETKAIGQHTYELELRDVNGKLVETKSLTTDDYGKASEDFELPKGGLTGSFSFRIDKPWTRHSFRVEEYKRPTFQVEIPEVTVRYADGDTVEVKGYAKTYAGVPVQGATVEYTVVREQARWWWRWYEHDEDDDPTLQEETVVTDDEGAFIMRVPVILPKNPDGDDARYKTARFYNFVASAKVTDQAGETHEGRTYLPLGTKATAFSCQVPEKELADELKTIRFSLRNAAGAEVDGDVRYRIDDGKEQKVKANVDVPIGKKLASGAHVLTAVCGTDTIEKKFAVFTLDDKKPCVETHSWFYATASEFPADGSPVRIQVGSSDPQTHVLYTILSGTKVLESGSFQLDNANRNLSFKYKDEYGKGLLLTFAWVRDGVKYVHTHSISRPLPDKRILLKWSTFRDKLKPGQNEEWTLTATRPDGKPADAQLIATLYDKSLDQIYPHSFSYFTGIHRLLPHTDWNTYNFSQVTTYADKGVRSLSVPDWDFDAFDSSLFVFWAPRAYGYRAAGGRRLMKSAVNETMMVEEDALSMDLVVVKEAPPAPGFDQNASKKEQKDDTTADTADTQEVQIRENLNETAFFKPDVVTDASGNLSLKFTLPESVTTWRFIGLVTDREMNNGVITADAVAKKDVMIQPNMPRFVRVGDRAKLSARIHNTSDRDISGTATMVLLDPETEKEVYTTSQKFSAQAGKTTSATFDYQPTGNGSMLICRMIASGEGFSDGEQHYLPILPDRELITRTLPITQHGPQLTTIDLARLFPQGVTDGKLTVEYTNNPAWLMIQALPSMGITDSDNAISQAAAFYANTIANHLLTLSPNIKSTIQQWMKEETAENSMMSNLSKNEELKDLLLNETPWVGDADKEEQQKRDLINLFDEEQLSSRLDASISKLRHLQLGDGSWPWWPGMRGSVYITSSVAEMFVRLNSMIGSQPQSEQMLDKAVKFLGNYLVEEAADMRKAEKKGYQVRPSEVAVDILYTFAIDGREQSKKVQEAQTYMVNILAKKTTELTIYGKAVTAVILAAHGKNAKASEYLQSINEYSVYTEEMGRYFDTRKAYYSWFSYAIPTEVAAIEAIKRLQPEDSLTVDQMRRWLLQEKRTQAWDTPINSVNAVYAFLDGNMGVLDQQEQTTLTVDGRAIDTSGATAGLGYVKTAMSSEGLSVFQADKRSQGTSWGALYAQFMQQVSEVENSSAGITVKREIIAPGSTLHVGDRVKVRITIKADRDYDFVEVIDRRAACMEPVRQLSTYQSGYYIATKDYTTNYYFDMFGKGTHVVETEYYIDREGVYETGTCKVQCAYAPEFSATGTALQVEVK